jgi:hypothetical protein
MATETLVPLRNYIGHQCGWTSEKIAALTDEELQDAYNETEAALLKHESEIPFRLNTVAHAMLTSVVLSKVLAGVNELTGAIIALGRSEGPRHRRRASWCWRTSL